MQTIDHDTEQMMTSTTGHDHGCWEDFAERVVAAHPELKIAGRHDDMAGPMTIWEHYTVIVLVHELGCTCQVEPEQDGTFEEV